MKRVRLILGCLVVLAAAVPAAAVASQRMPVGFQDDPSFRWRDDRAANLTAAANTGATIIRTTAYWSRIAPTKPANASDWQDPAYHFEDLDELVRSAGLRGMTVLITIWGTPGWANGNQGENHAPTNMGDLQSFSHALADRYSGRHPGFPFVGYYSLWNEPNLAEFLAPAYRGGKPASPAVYARMAKAFIAGVKAGNRKALAAIGETSPRGRQRAIGSSSTQDTIAPGLFAQLVAKAQPKLQFDAWAHHPYSGLGQGPTAKVAFPNVNLGQLRTFEKKLKQWFHRKTTPPIWITEYGFETRPGEPRGVSTARQAAYTKQTFAIIRNDPNVDMFIWFIFRDDPTSTWQSGLENEDNSHKPAYSTFSAGARALDVRNPLVVIKAGTSNPSVRIPVWELAARDGPGAKLGSTISVIYRGRAVGVKQPTSVIGIDGYASFKVPITKAKKNGLYVAYLTIGDVNGNSVGRVAEFYAG